MGSLWKVWTELPVDTDEDFFKRRFAGFFGAAWDEIMVGAENPFAMHAFWDGYFAVRGIKPVHGLTLADIAGLNPETARFNVLAG